MFFHIFKYRILQLLRSKDTLIWVIAFPLILGTMFYIAFGNMIQDDDEKFEAIPVAVVEKGEGNETLSQVVAGLGKGEDKMFRISWEKEKEATELLEEKTVDGILYLSPDPSLTVLDSDLNQSILSTFLSQYLQQESVILEIAESHPEKLSEVIEQMNAKITFNASRSMTGSENTNNLMQYFYALIAMVCLYGSNLGLDTIITIEPSLSSLGKRKSIVPVHKIKIILADFLASVTANFCSVLLLVFYLTVCLKIDLGDRLPLALLASLAGSLIGVSMGTFVGSIGRWSRNTKSGIAMVFSMTCCFLGGLMVNIMPSIVEHHFPLINRINPAHLLSDSYYVLEIYKDNSRYINNMGSMLLITLFFCLGSYLILRRKRS